MKIITKQEVWNKSANLLDHWDGVPNDVKSYLKEQAPSFYDAVETLARFLPATK